MTLSYYNIPSDPLRAVFRSEILAKLGAKKHVSTPLQWRLNVLEACGPMPTDPLKRLEIRAWRAQKAAWESYLAASFASGLFEGSPGKQLRAKLTEPDDDNFRGAMAECLACWYFSCRIGARVRRTEERGADFHTQMRDVFVGVEVKSPLRERPDDGKLWWGDDRDKIAQCIKKAGDQFLDSGANILVLVPDLRMPVSHDRETLVRALYGESVIKFDFNVEEARLENPRAEFRRTGKFLNRWLASGRPVKRNMEPGFRRISAVLCIEERLSHKWPNPDPTVFELPREHRNVSEYWSIFKRQRAAYLCPENESWVSHDAMILHNPHAYCSVPEHLWGEIPQFVPRGNAMEWTDGYKCAV